MGTIHRQAYAMNAQPGGPLTKVPSNVHGAPKESLHLSTDLRVSHARKNPFSRRRGVHGASNAHPAINSPTKGRAAARASTGYMPKIARVSSFCTILAIRRRGSVSHV